MDWDSNGDISFGEFVYAFTKWVDVETGDEDTVEHMVSVRVRLLGQERAHSRGHLLISSMHPKPATFVYTNTSQTRHWAAKTSGWLTLKADEPYGGIVDFVEA